jgi:hypothetical protein
MSLEIYSSYARAPNVNTVSFFYSFEFPPTTKSSSSGMLYGLPFYTLIFGSSDPNAAKNFQPITDKNGTVTIDSVYVTIKFDNFAPNWVLAYEGVLAIDQGQ